MAGRAEPIGRAWVKNVGGKKLRYFHTLPSPALLVASPSDDFPCIGVR